MLNSIRIRLTIWYLAVLALIIIGFAIAVYVLVDRNLNQTVDKNLSDIQQSVVADLEKEATDLQVKRALLQKTGEADDEQDAEPPQTIEIAIAEEIADMRFREFGIAVYDQSDKEIASSISDQKLKNGLSGRRKSGDIFGDTETFRVALKTLQLDGKTFQLFISYSLAKQLEFLQNLKVIFCFTIPIALFLAGLGGYFLARRSLAPVDSIGNQAAKIGATNLNARLTVKNEKDELGRLANVVNSLLARLENSFEQQRRFMADASHELRTPIAIVRAESEIAISDEKRNADAYRESLVIVHDESKRLTSIVEDLFLLARADSGQFEPEMKPVLLDEILSETVRAVRALAEIRGIEVLHSDIPEMPFYADESLLHRLFLNLLDNAIKYNKAGGSVLVEALTTGERYQINISNTGEGILPENQTKIFDRFYRADEARRRDDDDYHSGGAGLGLAIAVWIAKTHNGDLKLLKSGTDCSTFQVEFPLERFPRKMP